MLNVEVENLHSTVILKEFSNAQENLIPCKFKDLYTKEYDKFCKWRKLKNLSKIYDEKVVMVYLSEMSKVYKPLSLWCIYSKLKKMLKIKEKVDISKFLLITEYMKSNSISDKAKKSWVLQRTEIEEFMLKAPDVMYLLVKVAESYAENSLQNKIKIAQNICGKGSINIPQTHEGSVSLGIC